LARPYYQFIKTRLLLEGKKRLELILPERRSRYEPSINVWVLLEGDALSGQLFGPYLRGSCCTITIKCPQEAQQAAKPRMGWKSELLTSSR
jgi:hypothetical protein